MLDINKVKEECQNYLLKCYSLTVPDDWTLQCVEFLLETFPNKPINEYKSLIFKQLTDFDILIIETSCLPSKLFTTQDGFIDGIYFLQINLCIDASQSNFSQIQKLKGDLNENVLVDADNVPTQAPTQFDKKDFKKNRLMTLHLTDGTRSVKAFEYKYISCLNENICPGTKIELHGRIMYRNQVLFLGPENVKLLGGTVEELTTKENLISHIENDLMVKTNDERTPSERERKMQFDTSKNHLTKNSDAKPKCYPKTEPSSYSSSNTFKTESSSYSSTKNFKTENPYAKNAPTYDNNKNGYMKNCQKTVETCVIAEDDDDDDELLMMCDLDTLEKSGSKASSKENPSYNYNNNNSKNFQTNLASSIKRLPSSDLISNFASNNKKDYNINKINNYNNNQSNINKKQRINEMMISDDKDQVDDFEKDFKLINKPSSIISNSTAMEIMKSSNSASNPLPAQRGLHFNNEQRATKNTNNYLSELQQIFQDDDSDDDSDDGSALYERLDKLTTESFLKSCCLTNESQDSTQVFKLATCTHKIKGFIYHIPAALKQKKLNWYLDCVITDTKSTAEVFIGNDPLEKLMNMTCLEAKDLHEKSMQSSLPDQNEFNAKFVEKRKECDKLLKKMTCVMNLKYDFKSKKFCVFKIENIKYNRELGIEQ